MDRNATSRLGGILIEKGMITRIQLDLAVQEQARRRALIESEGKRDQQSTVLGEVLIDLGFITRLQLKRSLSWQMLLRKMTIAMSLVAPLMTLGSAAHAGPTKTTTTSKGKWSQTLSSSSSSSSAASSTSTATNSSSSSAATVSSSSSSSAPASSSSSSVSSSAAASLPLTIQAENYTDMYGVSTEATTDIGGGLNVGWIDDGDWISYAGSTFVAPTTGVYKVTFRAASPSGGGSFELLEGDRSIDYGKVTIPATGDWQNWTNVTVNITMTQGTHSLSIDSVIRGSGYNLNWIKVEYVGAVSSSSSSSSSSSVASTPTAAPASLPLTVQAENYTSMSGVTKETTSDTGGGQDVASIDAGDWISYSGVPFTAPATGLYKFTFRAASLSGGGSFQLQEADGSITYSTVNVPSTGGWQNWVDVVATAKLNAGTHSLKIAALTSGFNLNWFKVDYLGASLPVKIEAESYESMSGVATETTTDTGGGLNVGWIDTGDWMYYRNQPVGIPVTTNYKVTYRVASRDGGGKLALINPDTGAILDTIDVPVTGGWQTWINIEKTVALAAGSQKFGIKALSSGANLNWFSVEAASTTGGTTTSSSSSSVASSTATTTSSASSTSSIPTAVSSSSSSSAPATTTSSSSSSAPSTVTSSSSSSTSSATAVNGSASLKWNVPTQRENGDALDITEIGGYELRYRTATGTQYTYVTINDAWQDQYTFSSLQGQYVFEIAAFDKNGLYSKFVSLKPL